MLLVPKKFLWQATKARPASWLWIMILIKVNGPSTSCAILVRETFDNFYAARAGNSS
jgi:hypothetical protein